jgi:hypothetical protein
VVKLVKMSMARIFEEVVIKMEFLRFAEKLLGGKIQFGNRILKESKVSSTRGRGRIETLISISVMFKIMSSARIIPF